MLTDSERWLVIVGEHQMTADACAAVNATLSAPTTTRTAS